MGPAEATLPPPLKDGRYRLDAVLGEGGMATVYRAWDGRLQVERAVKVLSPAMARSPRIRERFLSEARTMARLAHPHVVGVVDVDEDDGRPFMVMELLTGGTLWGWVVDHGPMPPRLAVDACLAVLDGLAAAHGGGVVHRDIKPQNVLLSDEGVAKVTDFGIARVETADHRTRTAAVMGTWTYMPPEQRNSARDVDARADLYAVGAMLHALVTAQDPPDLFAADMDEGMLAALPGPLAEVVRTATRYRREDRYPSAGAMAEALQAARAALPDAPRRGRPVGTRPRRSVASLPPLSTVAPAGASLGDALAAAGAASLPPDTVPPGSASAGRETVPPELGGGPLSAPGVQAVPSSAGRPPTPGTAADPAAGATIAPPADGTLYRLDDPEAEERGPGLAGAAGLAAVLLIAVVGVFVVVRGGDEAGGSATGTPAGAAPAAVEPAAVPPAAVTPAAGDPGTPTAAATDGAEDVAVDGGRATEPTRPAAANPGAGSGEEAAPGAAAVTDGPAAEGAAEEAAAEEAAAEEAAAEEAAAEEAAAEEAAAEVPAAEAATSEVPAEGTTEEAAAGVAPAEPGAGAEAAAREGAAPEAVPADGASAPASAATASLPDGPLVPVSVSGSVQSLSLTRVQDGRRFDLGPVPPGEYVLRGRFFGDSELSELHRFRVVAGWDVELDCSKRTRTCR